MKKTMKLASRGKRLGAGLIDLSVPLVSYFILLAVYGISLASYGNRYGYGNGFGYGYDYGYNYGYNMPQSSSSGAGMLVLSFLLIAYLIAELVLYARGQSIGKAILGLQVVSSKDGKPFRFWKMMLRECIVKNASGSAFLLGYIWILIDEKNRGWHDKILDSYVVDLKETASMYQRTEAPDSSFTLDAPAISEETDSDVEESQTEREDDI